MLETKSTQKTQQNYDEMLPADLIGIIKKQETELHTLKQELSTLMSMIRLSNNQKYGKSGDSVPYPDGVEQLQFFNEAEKYGQKDEPETSFEAATAKVPKKPKEKGKRERDLSGLTVTVIEHELAEEEQICPQCGNELHEMKTEVTKVLKLVPAHFEVEEHRRHVYTCRECEKTQGEGDSIPFIRADMPALPIAGSFASAELLAGIINTKYVNHVPLARIESEFRRMDSVEISRQTMSNWMLKIAEQYMKPINERMKEVLLAKPVIHADETPCVVAYEDGSESRKKCYMWVYCTGIHDIPIVYYEFHNTRGFEAADEFLKNYRGFMHSDGYEVYHKLRPEITVVGCLAHIKRKFSDAIKSLSDEGKKNTCCYKGQEYCDAIFHIEKQLKELSPEERYQKRLVMIKPIMDAFYAWLTETFPQTVPDSPAFKAVQYALNQWPYFQNVLLDGRLECTNNLVERSIRPFAQGRANWMTIKTNRGGSSSAAIYSVIQTALANNLKVYEYLAFLLKEMPNTDLNKNPEQIDRFVPWSSELPANCYKSKS